MNEDKAAVALRLSIRSAIGATPGEDDSLRNIITDIFPDGALCFVNENRALYELQKSSVATPDNLTIVAPIAGPGRWVILGQGPGVESLVELVGTVDNHVPTALTANFAAIDSAFFAFQPPATPAGSRCPC